MLWLKANQTLRKHPKLLHLAALTGYPMEFCGFKMLCLWWWALDYAEDGDLSKFSTEQIAEAFDFKKPEDGRKFLCAVLKSGWIDEENLFIHDWLDYAGTYLERKYHDRNPVKWKAIQKKHQGQCKDSARTSLHGQDQNRKEEIRKEHIPPPTPPKGEAGSFYTFWAAYPKKKSKGQAERAWKKIAPDQQLLARMIDSIELAKTTGQWRKQQGRYIPHPATWLNTKAWEDEFPGKGGNNGGPAESKYPNDADE